MRTEKIKPIVRSVTDFEATAFGQMAFRSIDSPSEGPIRLRREFPGVAITLPTRHREKPKYDFPENVEPDDQKHSTEMPNEIREMERRLSALSSAADSDIENPFKLRGGILDLLKQIKDYEQILGQSDSPYLQQAVSKVEGLLGSIGWPDGNESEVSLFSPEDNLKLANFLIDHEGTDSDHALLGRFISAYRKDLLETPELSDLWVKKRFRRAVGKWVGDTIREKKREGPQLAQPLIEKALQYTGFTKTESRNLLSAWESFDRGNKGERSDEVGKRITDSLELIEWLDERDPSAPKGLFENFGIRNFYRFNQLPIKIGPTVLLKQWTNLINNRDYRSGGRPLVVAATHDYNGALDNIMQNFGSLDPVYFEAENLKELAQAVVRCRKFFGPVSSLLINAHGSRRGFALGSYASKGRHYISKRDVRRSKSLTGLRSKKYFTPGAEIILASCSTGARRGIGGAIAQKTAMDVIAPSRPAHGHIEPKGNLYEVIFNHDKPHFWRLRSEPPAVRLVGQTRRPARLYDPHD